jgi:hypothetical protein
MFRRCILALVAACSLAAACSGSSSGRNPNYPRRKPGCTLTIYNNLPNGPWDDIGPAEVGCYLDEAENTCLGRLKVEACRMGGDIIYNVPKKAARPMERGKIYRGMVAHSKDAKTAAEDAPEPADAGSGPITPLPRTSGEVPPTPGAPTDAGTQ